jgi:hypothetical protein
MAKQLKIIIPDAQVVIDLHRVSLWKPVTQAFAIGVTPIILQESRFYKDDQGQKHPIHLQNDIAAKLIREIETSIEQIKLLHSLLLPTIHSPLDEGELEAIAFLKSQKQDDYLFCSGDALAIKYIGALGLKHRAISLQKLLEQRNIKARLERKYSDHVFEKMVGEGLRDAHFLLRAFASV